MNIDFAPLITVIGSIVTGALAAAMTLFTVRAKAKTDLQTTFTVSVQHLVDDLRSENQEQRKRTVDAEERCDRWRLRCYQFEEENRMLRSFISKQGLMLPDIAQT